MGQQSRGANTQHRPCISFRQETSSNPVKGTLGVVSSLQDKKQVTNWTAFLEVWWMHWCDHFRNFSLKEEFKERKKSFEEWCCIHWISGKKKRKWGIGTINNERNQICYYRTVQMVREKADYVVSLNEPPCNFDHYQPLYVTADNSYLWDVTRILGDKPICSPDFNFNL